MGKKVRLESAGYFSEEGKEVSESVYERPVMLVYTGKFDSMDGEVEITDDHILRFVDAHNSFTSKMKRMASGDLPMKDCPPLQLDHSTSAMHTVGRLVGDLKAEHRDFDGSSRLALFGTARFLGKENVEKAKDGRWTHVSIGADLDSGKINELSVTPFPAAPNASLLSRFPHADRFFGEMVKKCCGNQFEHSSSGDSHKAVLSSETDAKAVLHELNSDGRFEEIESKQVGDKFHVTAKSKANAHFDAQMSSAKLTSYKGWEYELVPAAEGAYEIHVVKDGAKTKVKDHVGSEQEVDEEARRYIDQEQGEKKMHDKLKSHLMGARKMSSEEAEKKAKEIAEYHASKMGRSHEEMMKHMESADEAEMSRMADEHDEHMKKLAAEAAPANPQDTQELPYDKAMMTKARDGFILLAKGMKKDAVELRHAIRIASIGARLSRLRSQAKIMPAELKDIDTGKLAKLSDEALEASLETWEGRVPVVHFGSMTGTSKAEQIEAVSKKYRLARLELESRMNMPSKRQEAHKEMLKLSEAEKKELSEVGRGEEHAPSKGMLHKMSYEDLSKMLDEGRHEELKRHLKHLTEMAGAQEEHQGEGEDKRMSALAKRYSALQNQFDELVALTSPVLGIKSDELK